MSFGHAEKLSYKEDVGSVGMPEIFDTPIVLQQKIEQLALMIEKSKHLVAFTGAGISTSCGIPDFLGPKGVLTLKREGKSLPEGSLSFHHAMPSITHMALVELEKAGILKFVISQNVDSLHLRSGIPRERLAELHGNSFKEVCPSCGVEYLRDFEVETIGMKETSRCCSNAKCSAKHAKGSAKLKSTVIDWEDGLPPKEMNAAEKHCRMADVVLCLGTSLQITPASNLPLKSLHGGGKIVIVNLQQTPKDNKASLVIHGLVDKVIAGVMYSLNMRIPPFVRVDLVQIFFNQHCSGSKYAKWSLRVASVHGKRAPLPFIKSVVVSFPERPNLKTAVLKKEPFWLKREMLITRPLKMVLKLSLSDDCGCQFARIEFPVDFQAPVNINQDKNVVIQRLRDTAIQDQCCGQFSVVEREISSSPKKNIAIYAIATNIVGYSGSLASSGLSEMKLEAGTVEAPDLSVADNFVAGGDRTPSSAGFPAKPDISSPPGSPVNLRPSSPPAFVPSSPAGIVGCISADALRQKEEEKRRLAAESGLKRRSIESVAERTNWGDNQSMKRIATMPISHVPVAVETTKARTKKRRTEKRPVSEQDPGVILAQPSPLPSHPSINKTGKHAGEPSRRHDIVKQYSLAAVAESKQYDPTEAFDFFFKGFWKMGLVMTGLNHQFEELQRQAASSEAERQRAANLEAELGKLKLILEDKEGEVRTAKFQAAELESALDVAVKEKDAAENNLKTEKHLLDLELIKLKNALEESKGLCQEAERRAAAAEDKGYEDGFIDGYSDMGERIFRDHSDWDLTPYTASTSTLTNRFPTEEDDDDDQEDGVE